MLRGLRRLNRYEKRILDLVRLGGDLVRIKQLGFSSKTQEGFRFPIHMLEIGKEKAIKKNPVGMVAGVHGLETVGIRILLDFLEYILYKKSPGYVSEIANGKIGLVVIPIVNPGGVALKSRSNPSGVDLMRNSGVEAESAPILFGGQNWTSKLPYYRGKTLEPESRAVFRYINQYFYHVKDSILPVIDIHSGFGTIDHVWWPYARTKKECVDTALFEKIASYMVELRRHKRYKFGPQSETYTTHGDLWDRFYDHFQEKFSHTGSRFLPFTLEVGTWSDIKENPSKLFRKRGIFNPAKENKFETIVTYRDFLRDFLFLSGTKLKDWK
ncbi:zinc carboxypeptidase-related protein [Leptospira ryugenii]|uniref:Zinc carboxypeptidase-related protein n=1 Tax=Leptospira ryugenii TaxID=1917863 RepID=A0A2P2E2R9_9LEPT|nr:M14 family zinc carboxypeptidase [Leptospira ryugenii]GBF51203.1 zinc carboxypeptidase-related protein [Leptospira ryugenii]